LKQQSLSHSVLQNSEVVCSLFHNCSKVLLQFQNDDSFIISAKYSSISIWLSVSNISAARTRFLALCQKDFLSLQVQASGLWVIMQFPEEDKIRF